MPATLNPTLTRRAHLLHGESRPSGGRSPQSLWDPCYIAGWSAANHWALTDQVFRSTVVATAQRVRRVDQELAGASYLVHHVGADRLKWGLVGEWRGDRKVNVSGRERTVADILSDPALGGGIRHTMEVLNTLLSDAKLEDLVDALERLDNGAAIKRLGYLMEVLGYDTAAVDWPLTSGFPLLDPSLPSGGSRSITVGPADQRRCVGVITLSPNLISMSSNWERHSRAPKRVFS